MYGEVNSRLIKRMFIAWRRRRAGSVRDRVLSSLQSEGVLTFTNQVTLFDDCSKSQLLMDNHAAATVENHTDVFASNGYCVPDFETAVQSSEHNISAETANGIAVCMNDERYISAGIERNHHQPTVSRLRLRTNGRKLAVCS